MATKQAVRKLSGNRFPDWAIWAVRKLSRKGFRTGQVRRSSQSENPYRVRTDGLRDFRLPNLVQVLDEVPGLKSSIR